MPNGPPFRHILLLSHPLLLRAAAGLHSGRETLFEADVFKSASTFLLKEIAKKDRNTLESLTRVQNVAPIPAGNDRRLSQ